MKDLYFNELSADFTFSKAPSDKEEAKKLLLKFVNTSIAYILATGLGNDVYLQSQKVRFGSILLVEKYTVNALVYELEEKGFINEYEKIRFKSFISESYKETWASEFEYHFQERIVYGLGEAFENNTYSISLNTMFQKIENSWDNHQFELVKISFANPDENVEVSNISSTNHVFHEHEIWKTCTFVNNKPQQQLLPNKYLSESVVDSFCFNSWTEFYDDKSLKVTIKKKIGEIVAIVNGWNESSVCLNSHRPTYEAKNWYLTVDTENATFEVYQGKDVHLGEISFDDDEINTAKQDPNRGVCGKKGKK